MDITIQLCDLPRELVSLRFGNYGNGRLAIQLDMQDGRPYAKATINLPDDQTMEPDEVAIKDYAENTGMLNSLLEAGIVEPPHRTTTSGYCEVPICRLTPQCATYMRRQMPRNINDEADAARRAAERSDLIMGFDQEPSPKGTDTVDRNKLLMSIVADWPPDEHRARLDQMDRDARLFRALASVTSRANRAKFYAAQELAGEFEGLVREIGDLKGQDK